MPTTNQLNQPIGLFGLYEVAGDGEWECSQCIVKILDTKRGFFGGVKYLVQFGAGYRISGPQATARSRWVSAEHVSVISPDYQAGALKVWNAYEEFRVS